MISRYFLLFLFTAPFIVAGFINLVAQYKLGHIRKGRFVTWTIIWIFTLAGLFFAEPIYDWLFTSGLTQSDSLSLFDVVQITVIIILFYIVNRLRSRLEIVERRQKDLHHELSIRLSDQTHKNSHITEKK